MIDTIPFQQMLEDLSKDQEPFLLLSAVNYEERSTTVAKRLIDHFADSPQKLNLTTFRLVGSRPEPFSVLEIIKREYEEELRRFAAERRRRLDVQQVVHPASLARAQTLLSHGMTDSLVLDISTMPTRMLTLLTESALGMLSRDSSPLMKVYFVYTPPGHLIARPGLGPFSLMPTELLSHRDILDSTPGRMHVSLLTFLGPEGFEARLAIDSVAMPDSFVTVLVDMERGGLPGAQSRLAGNMSVIQDSLEGNVELGYFFSQRDALRLALDRATRAAVLCREQPEIQHGFIVAPFWPPFAVTIGCIARAAFERRAAQIAPETEVFSDTMVLSQHQYVSMFSRGATEPEVMTLDVDWAE